MREISRLAVDGGLQVEGRDELGSQPLLVVVGGPGVHGDELVVDVVHG